ncbi:MAG: FliH/SctL family protein [Thermodesulfovibrionales bacterium]
MYNRGRVVKLHNGKVFDMPALKKVDPVRAEPDNAEQSLAAYSAGRRAEEIERDAYEKGFAAGENAGLEMGKQKAALPLERLEKIIEDMQKLRQQVVADIELQIMDLAQTMARRIVLEELSTKPELIVQIVREALRRIEKTGTITIRINPRLHELFTTMKPRLLELHPDIVFDLDPSAPLNGAVVIGAKEEVVTDIDLQLKNMRDNIEGNLGAH